jgi:mannose-6-phosphate isomerase-like protein (cupin superfamily)
MFYQNIKQLTQSNSYFRRVIYTGTWSQLVIMSIPVSDDTGEENRQGIDQLLFVVDGKGQVILSKNTIKIKKNDLLFFPAGTKHTIKNIGKKNLQLYTIYSPSVYMNGTVHCNKSDAVQEQKQQTKTAEWVASQIYDIF